MPSRLQNKVYERRQVFGAHVFPVKHPVLLGLGTETAVLEAEARAAVVAEPHVLATAREHERGCDIREVAHPLHHVGLQPVLQQHWRLVALLLIVQVWQPHALQGQNLPITRYYLK